MSEDARREHPEVEARVQSGGGPARMARQARLGRLSARERIARLLDADSFQELGRYVRHDQRQSKRLAANRHLGDGVVCGWGRVAGRRVAVYAHDVTILRGSLGAAGARKLCKLLEAALAQRVPVVALMDSDGARILEAMDAVESNGSYLACVARLRRQVPQLTVAFGLCVGSAAYAAALTDVVAMVEARSFMFVTGPKITEVATREKVEIEDLGGDAFHARLTGQCHARVADDAAALAWAGLLLGYLQPELSSDDERDPAQRPTPELAELIPTDPRRAYDARGVVEAVFDQGSVSELAPEFAPNLLCGLARLDGRAVAYLASQPLKTSGVLDVDASLKGSRHLRLARTWGLPVVTLVDVPGYLPGRKQEAAGLLPHGAELIAAYAELETPSVCLVLRKSYGGASVMSFQADVRLALPDAVVAPTGVDAVLEMELGPEPEGASEEVLAARAELRAAWLERNGKVWAAAEAGFIDQVVSCEDARGALARALRSLL